jgi:hypothetical protein
VFDFGFFQQQLSWAGRIVTFLFFRVFVAGDMRVDKIKLAVSHNHETFLETDMARFNGFYFLPGQNQTGLEFFQNHIVKAGAFVESQVYHKDSIKLLGNTRQLEKSYPQSWFFLFFML